MASFLQNNGDVILDAVLTDYGRKLLAKGDGSFNIVKFAFGDDEIDYSKFRADAPTISQDIEIMNTPILEAFTNNIASMKHTLMTLSTENILYMPILKLNDGGGKDGKLVYGKSGNFGVFKGFIVPIDSVTYKTSEALTGSNQVLLDGVLSMKSMRNIIVDQGLDSADLDPYKNLMEVDPMLYESEYNIYVDSHYCYIGNANGDSLTPLGVDDDGIALYKVSQQSNIVANSYVSPIVLDQMTNDNNSVIAGTKGSRLQFNIMPHNNLVGSDYYFDKYGKSNVVLNTANAELSAVMFKTLRMPLKIVGATTGYSLDLSIMFAKRQIS